MSTLYLNEKLVYQLAKAWDYRSVGSAVAADNVNRDAQEAWLRAHPDIEHGVVVRMETHSALFLPQKFALEHGRGAEPRAKAAYKR